MPSYIDDSKKSHYDLIVACGLIRILISLIEYFTVFLLYYEHPCLLRFHFPQILILLLLLLLVR